MCRSSCISYIGKSNSSFIQGENAGLGSQAHNLQVNKAPDGLLQQLWKWGGAHSLGGHRPPHCYHLQPPASVQSYSYPTHTTSSLWIFRGREPYKGTGPRHKHLHATRKKALLCMSLFIAKSWSDKGSIGSDSALAGTQVTQRSWKGSWGRRLLTSRALKTWPFPELYCHLPAAGYFPKGEPGEETKCSSAASVPSQLNLVKSPSAAVWAKHTDLALKQESLPRAHPTRWHAALNSPGAPSPCVTPAILQAWTQQPSLCHPNIPALLSPS